MTREIPPRLHAAYDQHTAQLRDLVQMARDHRDGAVCDLPLPCPGSDLLGTVTVLPYHHLAGLFGIALAELAALGYGLPTSADRIDLTDRARDALDDDGGTHP